MFDRRHLQLLSYASICALLQFFAPTLAHSRDRNGAAGAVYTMSNDTSSNALLTFERNATGELTAKGVVPTGGRGTGAGLGNQGALALSDDGRWLVVVNAGSDDITLFDLKTGRPEPTARAASGGKTPISVSIEDDLVYVLNAGSDSIAGYRLNDHGRLEAVANSVRPLSGTGVGAAEIGISRGGRSVVVTEKATNKLTVYALDDEGRPARSPNIVPSSGPTPFGFSFSGHGTLLVAEAAGGASGASSVSSYRVGPHGALTLLQASAPTHQTAACWVIATPGGRYAYTANTPNATITGFDIGPRGSLSLLANDGVAARTGTGSGPTDIAIAAEGRLLYVLDSGSHAISVFHVGNDGALTPGPVASGLPPAANGIAAR